MASLSAEEKQKVRDLAASWLETEKVWRDSYWNRLFLAVLLYPLFVVHETLFGLFTILIVIVVLLFTCCFCFIACFQLGPCLRAFLRVVCKWKTTEELKQAEEAKRQQIIAAGGDPDELKDTLNDSCLTRSQRRMFQEKLWVRLMLFSPGRYLIAKNLEEVRLKSEEFLQQRSKHTYVLPKETVLNLTEWPKHEQAMEQGLLARTDIIKMKPPQTGARIFAPVLFVSHKWVGNLCDNEKNEVLQQVKERLKITPKSYVWFDYACVPQDDGEQRMMHLRSIPDIISRCEVGIFLHQTDLELAEKYMRSIWCQLEFVLSGLNMKDQKDRDWTIFDCNDLYLILPAFIDMTCRSENFAELFGDIRTTGGHAVFRQILQFFVKWHDENNKPKPAKEDQV